jgi:hypothetical protein
MTVLGADHLSGNATNQALTEALNPSNADSIDFQSLRKECIRRKLLNIGSSFCGD